MDNKEKMVTDKEVTKAEKPAETKEVKETKADRMKTKYSKYANRSTNSLRSDDIYLTEASADLKYALADGSNPTAKYLVQKFESSVGVEAYDQLIKALAPEEEFIGEGKGAEYGLVNGLAVNKLDQTKFIPEYANEMGNYTYWDTIDLAENPDDFDKVECTISLYLYVQYYLSGKIDELVTKIKAEIDKAFVRNQAKRVLDLVQTIFRQIIAKASSTAQAPTNHLVGTESLAQIDAFNEFLNFEFDMGFDNVQFNYDFEDAYNSLPEANRVYVCEKQTYNNFKKYAMTFLSKDKVDSYFKMNKWVVLPTSIYNNTVTGHDPRTKGSIEKLTTLSNDQGERVAGAILVLDNRAMKRVYNYAKTTSQYYAPNDKTQLFAFKNWAIKFLKWGQCAVYSNASLESNFVVPTKTEA